VGGAGRYGKKEIFSGSVETEGGIELDINENKRISDEREAENWEFRSFLKFCDYSSEDIDEIVYSLYKQIFSKIDCTKCGNCCKEIRPILNQKDVDNLVKGLDKSSDEIKIQYNLKKDEGEDGYTFSQKVCPFLKENKCSQYSCRPSVFRSYPHVHKKGFIARLIHVIGNYSICPIVFNLFESLKLELWHKRCH